MRVGIDISPVVYEGTGTAVYFKNLVTWLPKIGPQNDYVFFGASLRRQKNLAPYTKKIFPFPPTFLDFVWNRLHVMPVERLVGKIDVWHSSDWTQPPTAAKKVAPILDMVIYKFPESSHPQIISTQMRRLKWVKKEADRVVTISQASKKDIVEILGIAQEKVRVVYLAAGPEFNPDVKKYAHPKPYILTVGTREPRKNLDTLVAAFQKLHDPNLDLIIAGKYGWGKDVPPGVVTLDFVPQKDLPGLYVGAKCFVLPSLYEGFGLPVLEALSCGTPVICGRHSSLPEVAGDAATYANVTDATDLANKIAHVRKTGRELSQAKKFSWEKTARDTLKVYEELA